ncbi:MAG: ribonuclease H-like domain-containing protein [Acidobacteriota bacterium]
MARDLGDRLRQVLGTVPRLAPETRAPEPRACPAGPGGASPEAAAALGGRLVEREDGAVIVIERRYPSAARYGRSRIGDLVDALLGGSDALATLARVWPASAGARGDALCFVDLETTGLAGGAGTQAFLVGCAVADADGITVRQFLLPGFEHERALLAELDAWAPVPHALVTYNGRSFDLPLLETRYLFHRRACPFAERPHLDMLHAARRLWRSRPAIAGPPLDDDSCRLTVLERHLAGVARVGDVPGFEIPSRFFQFVRDGRPEPLAAVVEHNRLDLVSLALVTARAIGLVQRGPAATANARECLGLGKIFARAGAAENAEACFAHAADLAGRVGREPQVRGEALKWLAWTRRRAGRLAEAAEAWRAILDTPGCPRALRREAREALAIHHEHRSRDLESARAFVLDVLADDDEARRADAEHRLRRIERKLQRRVPGGLMAALDESS